MNVEITLDDRVVELRPTLGAAKKVSSHFGGFSSAIRAVAGLDFAAATMIVAAGLGKKPDEVEEAVFKAGLDSLVEPLARYVGLLANGGRSPEERKAEADPSGE